MKIKSLSFFSTIQRAVGIGIALFLLVTNAWSQGISISDAGSSPHQSAGLDVDFNDRGLLIPRLTTTERDAISSPADGLQIFNTTTKCLEIFINPIWQSIYCGCSAPASPAAGAHDAGVDQITWYWVSVNGALGYKYNVVNDYASATDNGNFLNTTQTGLSCGSAQSLYVWAYSNCGVSAPVELSESTAACFVCGSSSVNFTYRGSPVTYGTVAGQNGTCWLDRNLGASQVAVSATDANAYGDLFQWGRGDDNHQSRTSPTNPSVSGSDTPGHGSFITNSGSPYDWRNPQNDLLWQGEAGINNPCPDGWRLPTLTEFADELAGWPTTNSAGAFASPLKWTAAGYRYWSNGTLTDVGTDGNYWGSTTSGTFSYRLGFQSGDAYTGVNYRLFGMSVRCVRD